MVRENLGVSVADHLRYGADCAETKVSGEEISAVVKMKKDQSWY